MPNEFRIKNGFFSEGSSNITGSLSVSGSITIPITSGRLGISQTTPTSRLHLNANQNSETQNDANGILLANSTAATNGVQSISPALVLQGNGWKTDATAGSQDTRFRIDTLPVQGSTNPTANLRIASSINNAAYTTNGILTSAGDLSVAGGFSAANQIQVLGVGSYTQASYKLTNGGSIFTTQFIAGSNSVGAGFLSIGIDYTSGGGTGLLFFGATNNARIARASINIVPTNNTPVSESADLILQTQSGGTAMTTKMLISGSGNVSILSGSLGINQTAPTSRLHINANQFGITQNDANGILLANTTAAGATAASQSISPPIVLQGNGWRSASPTGSQDVRFRMDVLPIVVASLPPRAEFRIASSINNAAYNTGISIDSSALNVGLSGNALSLNSSQLNWATTLLTNTLSYRQTTGGSIASPLIMTTYSNTAVDRRAIAIHGGDQAATVGIVFTSANGTNNIAMSNINIANVTNATGSESADLIFQTKSGSIAMTTKMTIGSTGDVSILSGSLITSAVTSSFFRSGSNLINLSNASGITISTVATGSVTINPGLTGTVNITSPLIVTGSILSLDNITAYSDESVKSNVVNIPNALNKVLEMRGVTYTRTDLQDTERIHAGVIAQELERQFPEVVYELPNGKKTVAYGNITSILIEAIKEQQKQIDDLRKQIEKLT